MGGAPLPPVMVTRPLEATEYVRPLIVLVVVIDPPSFSSDAMFRPPLPFAETCPIRTSDLVVGEVAFTPTS